MAMLLWSGMRDILLDLMSLDCLGFGKAFYVCACYYF